LLYRGSEQDFTSANFVKLVGGQGPTLHIIKSEHDHLFGGCAFEKYPNPQNGINENKQDDKAFLFQLHPNQVMLKNTLHATYKREAIRCYSNSLSMFGAGVDLYICETKSVNKSNAYFGYTYELPQGYNV
jgi:hypothetical protein